MEGWEHHGIVHGKARELAASECLPANVVFVVLAMAFGPSLAPLWPQPLLPTCLPVGAGRVSVVVMPPFYES